ncbi:hypothetical protein [Adhaeribacter pallidiroseus]|uniref:Uncharacterized protein n=1 Tax=Adhaeribacter pallidiroseus TaxID=2072847 RepID=A0A369QC51_9BACT|nr:hypothetical protein [Adhaeribacter pallidiroseus]RDC62471.1 hypothetical protein AHMF7616_01065 [Adhaeribacter pallidiroseus]
MSDIATYTFLPWLRQGIANQISETVVGFRATIPIDLELSGDKIGGGTLTRPPIHKDIQIYGPGDITGLDPRAIIKVEPRNWITNFEPNYLPYIEFYDEDLPWRYSPLKNPLILEEPNAENHRLTPWLALVVLREDEFEEGKNSKDSPLPFIIFTGDPTTVLAPANQLWAWAHVHVNRPIITSMLSTDSDAIQTSLATNLQQNPDLAYSRLICPRRLQAQTAYSAFLVPVFESGRLAGLGENLGKVTNNALAWGGGGPFNEYKLPYYHRWYFRTGTVGDFEYLVRLLKPQPVDSRVGVRSMDVQKPGANLKGITDEALNGILKLGGALQVPRIIYTDEELAEVQKYENWAQPYPHAFQTSLAAFINLANDYQEKPAAVANANEAIKEESAVGTPVPGTENSIYSIGDNPDPIITAPLYAQWHALTQRLEPKPADNPAENKVDWVHELNLDPRWRVAAGFGTKVIQENQENYMKSAWDQVGEVLEANKKIRAAQLAKTISQIWYFSHLQKIKDNNIDKWFTLASPVSKRILAEGTTVYHAVKQSKVPLAATSVTMRRILRPRGELVKRLPFNADIRPTAIISRINKGEATAAPPKTTPDGINSLQKNAEVLLPDRIEKFQQVLPRLMKTLPTYRVIWSQLGDLVPVYRRVDEESQKRNAMALLEEAQDGDVIDKLPRSPIFRLSRPDEANFRFDYGGEDNEEAQEFKKSLVELHKVFRISAKAGATREKPALNMDKVSDALFESINPALTIPRWTWGSVRLPERIRTGLKEQFVEAMAYPEFDLPMYKPLVDYSSELFLPNINQLAQNSISLLETNQKFIEAYMVGLNHEFARELLWREYPTDQRGSYFRQFWETKGYLNHENLSPEALKEKLRDIPPLHIWPRASELGDHDHREADGAKEQEVVLVIRGELLKKYPNAVIYAHKAEWAPKDDGTIDLTKERNPVKLETENLPSREVIKTPLYEAKVDPDIYFFGFDITACAAKGGAGKPDQPVNPACADANIPWDDPGWFFVIKERPGEPRFGLDIASDTPVTSVQVWNDLSWNHLTPAVPENGFIQITAGTTPILLQAPTSPEDQEKKEQYDEDKALQWNLNMSSAELAYVLYQVPVLVAVHASEMLPDN